MADPQSIDDLIRWAPEDGHPETTDTPCSPWRVLIVDDDLDVHQSTEFALRKQQILDRPLEFLHAHSAAEARRCLGEEPEIAVVLLDVVMESDDAGLRLVREIRETLGLHEVRIILRTGQPGYAPEVEAIRDYDINDYKTKTELTRNKLYTALTTAIRSYDQIRQINANSRGLQQLVEAGAELVGHHELTDFCRTLVDRVAGLLGTAPDGLACIALDGEPRVIAARGRYAHLAGQTLSQLPAAVARERLARLLERRCRIWLEPGFVGLYVQGRHRHLALYLEADGAALDHHRQLLELMASNLAVCLDNVSLVEQLHGYAYYDPLLNLPNRIHFLKVVDALIAAGKGSDYVIALIDIDHFASTNDVLGHRFGDALLQAVAERLQQPLCSDCTLARIAPDTFGLLGPRERVSPEQVNRCLQRPFRIQGYEHRVSATTGLVCLGPASNSGEAALQEASIALKRAKDRERGHGLYFQDTMAVDIREKMLLVQELRKAMETERLFLVYQPQIDLASGRTVGVEALLRWRDDRGRLIPPDRFIPLAEQSGLINALGEWVLRAACAQLQALAQAGFEGVRMAVNVSVNQFENPLFMEMLDRVLLDTRVDPALLELEITESVAVLDPQLLTELLNQLKNRRITLAIDDFGTGFSSLSYLQRLPVDRLKIDRSFIQQMDGAPGRTSIAEMVITLAKSLELAVIAEGVEVEAQAQWLRALGCDEVQGYLFAHPLEPEALRRWLQTHSASSPP